LAGDLACLQVRDGKIIWQRSLQRDFGGRVPTWSYRESPLLDGDKFLWRYDRSANSHGISCSTPIYHDGLVFAASAYGAGGGLVKLGKDANGGVKAEEVYSWRMADSITGPRRAPCC
jgi:hypothetical protein